MTYIGALILTSHGQRFTIPFTSEDQKHWHITTMIDDGIPPDIITVLEPWSCVKEYVKQEQNPS